MALSNTAVPKYYGMFRDAVLRGEIPVNHEISMEMNRIDALIENPGVYYDDEAVEGWIRFCENEMTLTDGSDVKLLDSFKLWGEQVFGWYNSLQTAGLLIAALTFSALSFPFSISTSLSPRSNAQPALFPVSILPSCTTPSDENGISGA